MFEMSRQRVASTINAKINTATIPSPIQRHSANLLRHGAIPAVKDCPQLVQARATLEISLAQILHSSGLTALGTANAAAIDPILFISLTELLSRPQNIEPLGFTISMGLTVGRVTGIHHMSPALADSVRLEDIAAKLPQRPIDRKTESLTPADARGAPFRSGHRESLIFCRFVRRVTGIHQPKKTCGRLSK
jgi:hypothetical protein